MPATAPIAAAMPQPSAVIQPTRMPTSRADSGLCGGGAHRQAEPGAAEEQRRAAPSSTSGHADHAGLMRVDQLLPNSGLVPNGVGKVLIV